MKIDPKTALEECDTLMLDMDGTVLDLAFDHYIWMHHVPEKYAERHGVEVEQARQTLYAKFEEMLGQLEWYCLDHWSEFLDLDIAGIHRDNRHRIGFLPGAKEFLDVVSDMGKRLLLVSNSHAETLEIKNEVTGVTEYFDGIHLSHTYGHPKETRQFWQALAEADGFDPQKTLFIDDTVRVLDSAHEFGVGMLLEVMHPDTSTEQKAESSYAGILGIRDLV
ncbi:MAG: GMP/IMP nucleotidase [Woeseiaceae bacterium]|nr:GMP/IMP nucleotidase [Woeseiaceae bacterium]